MNDCMTFPDTVEEFMEQYKVVDTEHIYTNGSEFVPIFRMKQWFKHLPSAQPERKTGRWIHLSRHKWIRTYKCDQCGNILDFDGVNAGRGDANFCPNCGTSMRGEQDG